MYIKGKVTRFKQIKDYFLTKIMLKIARYRYLRDYRHKDTGYKSLGECQYVTINHGAPEECRLAVMYVISAMTVFTQLSNISILDKRIVSLKAFLTRTQMPDLETFKVINETVGKIDGTEATSGELIRFMEWGFGSEFSNVYQNVPMLQMIFKNIHNYGEMADSNVPLPISNKYMILLDKTDPKPMRDFNDLR